jgi:hypothetical protein
VIWLAASPADEASKGLNFRLVCRAKSRRREKRKKTTDDDDRPTTGSKYRE